MLQFHGALVSKFSGLLAPVADVIENWTVLMLLPVTSHLGSVLIRPEIVAFSVGCLNCTLLGAACAVETSASAASANGVFSNFMVMPPFSWEMD
jgi:hypothetical protein